MTNKLSDIKGTVEVKKEIPNLPGSLGLKGDITAFIPRIKLFSISFEDGRWITFDNWSFNRFNEYFNYELFNKENTHEANVT